MALPYPFQCSVKVELLFIVLNFQNLPKSFVRANGLETRCGDIVLMNEKGRFMDFSFKTKTMWKKLHHTRVEKIL